MLGEFDAFKVELARREETSSSDVSSVKKSVGAGHQLLFYHNFLSTSEMLSSNLLIQGYIVDSKGHLKIASSSLVRSRVAAVRTPRVELRTGSRSP